MVPRGCFITVFGRVISNSTIAKQSQMLRKLLFIIIIRYLHIYYILYIIKLRVNCYVYRVSNTIFYRSVVLLIVYSSYLFLTSFV